MAGADNAPSPYARVLRPRAQLRRRRPAAPSVARRRRLGLLAGGAARAMRRLVRDTRPGRRAPAQHLPPADAVDRRRARGQGVPTVMTLHDYKIVCPAYTLFTEGEPLPALRRGHPLARRCRTAASRARRPRARSARSRRRWPGRAARTERIDALISPSRFLADLAATAVPAERVHVVPNFLPRAACPRRSRPPIARSRRALRRPPRRGQGRAAPCSSAFGQRPAARRLRDRGRRAVARSSRWRPPPDPQDPLRGPALGPQR